VRDRDTVDSELRLLAAERRTIREQGIEPSSRPRSTECRAGDARQRPRDRKGDALAEVSRRG
jgi:hypothetical protein